MTAAPPFHSAIGLCSAVAATTYRRIIIYNAADITMRRSNVYSSAMNPCPTAPRPTPHGVAPRGGALASLSSRRGTGGGGASSFSTFMLQRIPCLILLLILYLLNMAFHDVAPSASSITETVKSVDTIRAPIREAAATTQNEAPKESKTKQYEEQSKFDRCRFREYPSHRYYGVNDPLSNQPTFISEAKYIRATKPVVLNPPGSDNKSGGMTKPQKICIDTSEWERVMTDRYPFSDGQNPSIVTLSAQQRTHGENIMRLPPDDATIRKALREVHGTPEKIDNMFMGVLVVGNAQCRWRMGPDDIQSFHYSDLEKAPDRRTIVTILDAEMKTLNQMTLMLEHDGPWGTKRKKGQAMPDNSGKKNSFKRSVQYFDDPRFFFHKGQLMMLYRHGARFGYENQVQNPIHLEVVADDSGNKVLQAYVKASETFTVCCGRNIALLSENDGIGDGNASLKAVTWVDPVTVIDVDPQSSKGNEKKNERKEKSHIHGTNGWMIPLHSTNEFLGIAHFHRPEDRKESEYALHGHHYTHTFFTIARNDSGEFKLKRLSNEFLFQAMSPSMVRPGNFKTDAETIQFSSGLDLKGSDVDGQLLISYGVNDCEGGSFFVDMKAIQSLLLDVPAGKEVVDLMAKVSTGARTSS